MKNEPEWIEHDGSAMCPVPAGHDVEVRFGNGKIARDKYPQHWGWSWDNLLSPSDRQLIAAYRDWTAWEQQQASAVEVPEWVAPVKALLARTENYMAGAIRVSGTPEYRAVRALIAANEPEPVDPLLIEAREIAATWFEQQHRIKTATAYREGAWDGQLVIEIALAALKRGMELARVTGPARGEG